MQQIVCISIILILLISSDAALPVGSGSDAVNLEAQWDHAVYLEGTVGSLEEAVKIYDAIANATEDKELQAHALLRASQCYSRLGLKNKAASYNKRLKIDFAEIHEIQQALQNFENYLLDSKAKLLPSPWLDGEVLEYQSFDVNQKITSYTTRVKSKLESENGLQWKTENVKVDTSNNIYRFDESVTYDEENRFAHYKTHYLGDVLAELSLSDDKLTYEEATKNILYQYKYRDNSYLTNDLVDVIRRLPLSESYNVNIPVFEAQGVSPYQAKIEVISANEEVEVPAGQFTAFHVKITYVLNNIVFREEEYWIAKNESRLLVQYIIGNKKTKLMDYRSTSAYTETAYKLNDGLTIKLPPRWLLYDVKSRSIESQTYVLIPFNGQSVAQYGINTTTRDDWDSVTLEQLANESIAWAEGYYIDYKMRPNSLRAVQVSEHAALRYISDFKSSIGNETEDRTLFPMRTEKYVYHIVFYSSKERVNTMQNDHDYIINNVIKVKRDDTSE